MKFENKSYRCLEIDNNGFSTFIDDACKLLCGACFDRLYFYNLEASQFFNSSYIEMAKYYFAQRQPSIIDTSFFSLEKKSCFLLI